MEKKKKKHVKPKKKGKNEKNMWEKKDKTKTNKKKIHDVEKAPRLLGY
jgi:hypothetical protein